MNASEENFAQDDVEEVKQSLIGLLPSEQDATTLVMNTTAWLWGAETPAGTVLGPDDVFRLLEVAAVSHGGAIDVAKSLLLYALYAQQLPAHVQDQHLESGSIGQMVSLIVGRIRSFIMTHDNEAACLDGIECLTLLSLIQINEGALKDAWLIVRRTLDLARLLGLHKSFFASERNCVDGSAGLRRRLWLSAVCGELYCSLLLGLEPGIGSSPFGQDDGWIDTVARDEATAQRHIGLIVERIAKRNALGEHGNTELLTEINNGLESFERAMAPDWWTAPSFHQDPALDSAKEANRLVCQLWFFQARIFAHLPWALRKNPRFKESENSASICLEACRITLLRCTGLQYARNHLRRCRTVDQAAVLAAIILLLLKLQFAGEKNSLTFSCDSDGALLEQMLEVFEDTANSFHNEIITTQGAQVLRTLMQTGTAHLRCHVCEGSNPYDQDMPPPQQHSGAAGNGVRQGRPLWVEDVLLSSVAPLIPAHTPAAHVISFLFEK